MEAETEMDPKLKQEQKQELELELEPKVTFWVSGSFGQMEFRLFALFHFSRFVLTMP
ncbi:GH11758 [Drosophila grimshawi]|uniref:GH11758 n=1 Tax=Drosophila grimshawi TaxID=7222 RepID=B4K472_DROGR|nr:GH11758 [Drosophila grimshawi]